MARNNELKEWKSRLAVAHKRYKPIEAKIDRAWNYYRGEQWGNGNLFKVSPYNEKVVDNVVFANIRGIIPRLNYRNPRVYVKPTKKPFPVDTKGEYFDTIAASTYFEIVLNHYYKTLQIKREARKCLYDALLAPFAVMELGYSFKTEKVKTDEEGELLEVNELITEDSPYVMRRSLKDFRSDPEGIDTNLNDARWIALKWVKDMSDLKADSRYSNLTSLKPNYTVKTNFDTAVQGSDREEDCDEGFWGRVQGWTVWDRKTHRLMDVVEGHDKFLRNEKAWPLELDGFPVETLYFNENDNDIFPIPDVWQYLPLQDELNRIGSMQLDHIKRISQRKYVSREGAFNEQEMDKITYGGDGTIAMTTGNPMESLYPIQDATISSDIYTIRQGLKQVIREMAGVSDAEMMSASKFESATEPALIDQASKTLRGDQQGIFENFLSRIVGKLGVIIQQTAEELEIPIDSAQWDDDDIRELISNKLVKIAGPEGAQLIQPWLKLDTKDIAGEYVFEIEVGSTLPENEQQRKQDAIELATILKDNPYIKVREGTKELLAAFKKTDPEKLLKTDEEVEKGMQASKQEALQMEQAKDAPKREVDFAKTQLKSQTTKEVAMIKAHSAMSAENIKAESVQRTVHGNMLATALKSRQEAKKPETE